MRATVNELWSKGEKVTCGVVADDTRVWNSLAAFQGTTFFWKSRRLLCDCVMLHCRSRTGLTLRRWTFSFRCRRKCGILTTMETCTSRRPLVFWEICFQGGRWTQFLSLFVVPKSTLIFRWIYPAFSFFQFQDNKSNHDVTITMFSRTFYDARSIGMRLCFLRFCFPCRIPFLFEVLSLVEASLFFFQRNSQCTCVSVFRWTIRVGSMKIFTGIFPLVNSRHRLFDSLASMKICVWSCLS